MKTSVIILSILFISSIKLISNEEICEIMKTNGIFSGVKAYHKWVETIEWVVIQNYKKYFRMYANGKDWEFHLQFDKNKKPFLTFNELSIKDIDKFIIKRFGVVFKKTVLFVDTYSLKDCLIFHRVFKTLLFY